MCSGSGSELATSRFVMKRRAQVPVNELVAGNCRWADVLDAHHIDFCGQDDRRLIDLCEEAGLEVQALVDQVDALSEDRSIDFEWVGVSISDLTDDIVATHHAYVRRTLPILWRQMYRIVERHGQDYPGLEAVVSTLHRVRDELERHLLKEERLIFRLARTLEQTRPEAQNFPRGLRHPLHLMIREHRAIEGALEQLDVQLEALAPLSSSCLRMQSFSSGYRLLREDLKVHFEGEERHLFPAIIALEDALARV